MADEGIRDEPVTFPTSVNVSAKDLDTLNRARLPKNIWGVGTRLEEPVGIDVPGLGYLIQFAQGYHTKCYFDPATGAVWEIDTWPGLEPDLVNSTLEQFMRSVQAVCDAFPFSAGLDARLKALPSNNKEREAAEDRDVAERFASATKILNRIREIDPAAMIPNSFWENFTLDVQIEDFSGEGDLNG